MAATPTTETSLKVKKTRKTKKQDLPSSQHPDGTASSPIRPPSPPLGHDGVKSRRLFSGPTATLRKKTPALAQGDGETGEEDESRRRQPARAREILQDFSPEGPPRPSRGPFSASSLATQQKASASAPELLIPSIEFDNDNDNAATPASSRRPKPNQRSVSAPEPPKAPESPKAPDPPKAPWVIDRDIAKLLRCPPSHQVNPGYTYLLEATHPSAVQGLFKFGKSIDPNDRLKSLKNKCGYALEPVISLPELKHFAMVEKLVLAELSAFRFRGPCPNQATGKCTTKKHREYLRVPDRGVLEASVRRWHAFCAAEPWSVHGGGEGGKGRAVLRLHPRWAARLREWPSLPVNCWHDDLARSWGEFISPTWLQRAWYDVKHVLSLVLPYGWQIIAVTEALAFVFYFRTYSAVQWLLFLCICIVAQWLRPDQTWIFSKKTSIIADGGKAKKAVPGGENSRVGGGVENPLEIFSDHEAAVEEAGDAAEEDAGEPMDESGIQEDESFLTTEFWDEIEEAQPSPTANKSTGRGLLRPSTIPDSEDDDGDITMGDDDDDLNEHDTMEHGETQELPALLVALKVS